MRNRKRLVAGLILMVLFAAGLSSQSMNAQIFGNVKNEGKKDLRGVVVTVTNLKNNAVTSTTTGKKGTFRFLSLAAGSYQVGFDLEGYESYAVSGIQLNSEQSVTLRIKLKKKD